MILSLYMDVHIPRAITEGLRLRGVDVLTAQEDGSGEVSDSVGDCVRDLELLCKAIEPREMLNRVEFIPLK